MKIAAIDPGLSGAAVILEQINGAVMLIGIVDLPIMGEGAKRRLDAFTFARWLYDHALTHAYVENACAMPKQGVTSMFRYGCVAGAIEGTVAACRIPMTMIEPAMWKRHLRLNSKKEDCRARAIQLLPDAAGELQRIKDHQGRGDPAWLLRSRERGRGMKHLPRAQQQELVDNARLLRAWKAWHREQLDEALAGPHGPMLERLVYILKTLAPGSASLLLAYIRGVDWSSVDYLTRLVALHEVNVAITKLREKSGQAPFDDGLPGERDNAFRVIRKIIG